MPARKRAVDGSEGFLSSRSTLTSSFHPGIRANTESFLIPYFCLLLLTLVARPAEGFEPPRPDSDFETSAAAIFSADCVDCHNGQEKKGGLDLTTRKSAFREGNTGPGLIPGDLNGSQVWERIRSGEMPRQENSALDQLQFERLRKWILAGAEWPHGRRLTDVHGQVIRELLS